MGASLVAGNNELQGVTMKKPGKRSRDWPTASLSTAQVERKTTEKNRRNMMKKLYSTLNSLVPNNNEDPKEARSIPAQIDEAAKYIKYLEATVNEAKKKKERLMVGKRLQHSTTDHCNTRSSALETSRSPKLDIRVRGSTLEVTLVSGTCSRYIFSDVIRVLHEGRAQVLNANVSVTGNSVYHLMHAEIGQETEAAAVAERLKELVNGPSSTDGHQFYQEHHLWDFDISPNIWEFDMFHAWHSA